MPERVQVYGLQFDSDHVSQVQLATLETTDFGLVPDPHLYGSPAWWADVESGRIPTRVVSGTISRVFMSGHNDWPEFEIDTGREKSCWNRAASDIPGSTRSRSQLADLYQTGASVELSYVEQRFKKPIPALGEMSRCVVEIWITPAVKQAVAADTQQLGSIDPWYRSGGGRCAPALAVSAAGRS